MDIALLKVVRILGRVCTPALLALSFWILAETPALCQMAPVEKCAAALQSPDWSTRAMAVQTLRALQDEAWKAQYASRPPRANDPGWHAVFEHIGDILHAAFLSESNGFVRNEIARSGAAGVDLLDTFRRQSTDPNPVIRASAIAGPLDHLGTSGLPPSTVNQMVSLLDDQAVQVRINALDILDRHLSLLQPRAFGPPRRLGKLSRAELGGLARLARDLEDPDPFTRSSVGRLLGSRSFDLDAGLKAAANAAGKEAGRLIGAWNDATETNTVAAYREFGTKYPQGPLAEEAKRRAGDPGYAFLQTIVYVFTNAYADAHGNTRSYGSKELLPRRATAALRGFQKSHPDTALAALTHDFDDYLAIRSVRDVRKFIAAHPDSPFLAAATLRSPILTLKRAGGTVALAITVENVEFKGALGGSTRPEKVRKNMADDIQKQLGADGISAVLLDANEQTPRATDVRFHLDVTYRETARPAPRQLDSSFQASAANLLAGAIWNPADTTTSWRVIDTSTGFLWLDHVDLDGVAGPWNVAAHLGRESAGKRQALACFLLTLPHVDLADPKQREEARATLQALFDDHDD